MHRMQIWRTFGWPRTGSVKARLVTPPRWLSQQVLIITCGCMCFVRRRYSRCFPGWKRTCDFEKRRTSALVEMSRRFVKRVWKPNPSGLNSIQKLFGINTIPFSSIEDWRLYKVWPWWEHCRSRSEQDLHEKETTQRSGEQRHQFECFRWITTEVSIWWLVYRSHQNAKNLHSRRNEWTYIKVKEKYWLQHPHPLYFNEC